MQFTRLAGDGDLLLDQNNRHCDHHHHQPSPPPPYTSSSLTQCRRSHRCSVHLHRHHAQHDNGNCQYYYHLASYSLLSTTTNTSYNYYYCCCYNYLYYNAFVPYQLTPPTATTTTTTIKVLCQFLHLQVNTMIFVRSNSRSCRLPTPTDDGCSSTLRESCKRSIRKKDCVLHSCVSVRSCSGSCVQVPGCKCPENDIHDSIHVSYLHLVSHQTDNEIHREFLPAVPYTSRHTTGPEYSVR